MDILDALLQEHQVIRDLFDRYDQLGPRSHAERRALFHVIRAELESHHPGEEEFLYPAIRAAHPGHLDERVEEHRVVRRLLAEIALLGPEDRAFPVKFLVLRENVEHHLREEELELYERARASLSSREREDLGRALAAARGRAAEPSS